MLKPSKNPLNIIFNHSPHVITLESSKMIPKLKSKNPKILQSISFEETFLKIHFKFYSKLLEYDGIMKFDNEESYLNVKFWFTPT